MSETVCVSRRSLLVAASSACVLPVQAQALQPQALVQARDLRASAQASVQAGHPLVVMVSLEHCPFCRIARDSHLLPLVRQGWRVEQLDMRSNAPVLDFDGRATTHDEMARRWRIRVAPTVLFLGEGGVELAERMRGAYQPDFYGPYLQERLDAAQKRLHG